MQRLLTLAIALLSMLPLASCGDGVNLGAGSGGSSGGGGNDPQQQQPTAAPTAAPGGSPTSLYFQTQAELPPCDASRQGSLAYIAAEKKFVTCATNAWSPVEIKGEKGDPGAKGDAGEKGAAGVAGAAGAPGKDGASGGIIHSYNCSLDLNAQGGVDFSAFTATYWLTDLDSGDTWVTASIYGSAIEISSTSYYAADQVGALTGGVTLIDDVYGTAGYGFWSFQIDRNTDSMIVKFNDLELPTTSTRTWTGSCTEMNH